MSNREAAEQLMRHFFSPGDPQWSSKLGALTTALDAAEQRGLGRAAIMARDHVLAKSLGQFDALAESTAAAIRALAVKP